MTEFIIFLISFLGLAEDPQRDANFRNSAEYDKYEKEYYENNKVIITYEDMEEY